jgi:penicillin-binding protein 1C
MIAQGRLPKRRAALLAAVCLGSVAFWRSLPDPLFAEPASFVMLDRDGELLAAKIADDEQWRFPAVDDVPAKYEESLLTFEDRRFYRHPGVDPLAIARALYLNLSAGRVRSGGSTITMQVIRLARGNPDRTYTEKLVEAVLAIRLELGRSKKEILALYASHAPFGGNVVGLEAASWRYFGRAPGALSWAEAATLAVLPNAPNLVHPGKNRGRLKEKRDALLRTLAERGSMSALDLEVALAEPLPEAPHPLPRLAPHLLETALSESNGAVHRVETTVSASLQRVAEGVVERHAEGLRAEGVHNAAVLVVDNSSFEVLAYVGNVDAPGEEERGQAVDVVRRPRSTGSILKPFLFAAMLQAGEILPSTLVPDVPVQYAGFMPENYDLSYRGAVPARVALAQSLNVPAVHMLKRYGVDRFEALLRGMGMTTLFRPPDDYGLTLILGGAEGTLWDVTSMYANLADIARRQNLRAPYRKLKVLNGDGARSGESAMAEIGPAAAWLTLDALTEVTRPDAEGHWRNFASSSRIAWKTGTSFGLRDGWAVGTTSRYTIGVWVGNASGEGRPGLTGATTAGPILFDLFSRLGESSFFPEPFRFMRQVDVCRNDGYLAAGNCETVAEWVPAESHFEEASPNNRRVHLDETARFRVEGDCESPGRMEHRSWFVLPPAEEYYYRKRHAEYRPLPPYRKDCRDLAADGGPIEFLYPHVGTRLYIPMDLAAHKGRTVFEAVHRDPDATLFWHLDERFLGETRTFHQQALDIAPGLHVLTVVDGAGNRLSRTFEVLGESK